MKKGIKETARNAATWGRVALVLGAAYGMAHAKRHDPSASVAPLDYVATAIGLLKTNEIGADAIQKHIGKVFHFSGVNELAERHEQTAACLQALQASAVQAQGAAVVSAL